MLCPKRIIDFVSLLLQNTGVTMVLGSNLSFWWRARTCGGVKGYSLHVVSAIWGEECEELRKLPMREIERLYKSAPLAQWIYSTWKYSFIGSVLSLLGVLLSGIAQFFN